MVSDKRRTPPSEEQFIRFIDTVREIGNEPALDELDETLIRLVPPVRAEIAGPRQDDTTGLHRSPDGGPRTPPDPR